MELVDGPLLKVPFESLKRAAKDRKSLVDDVVEAVGSITSMPKGTCKEDQLAHLQRVVTTLQGIKRKMGDVSQSERDEAHRVKARLEHLQVLGSPKAGQSVSWNKQRLDRLLVDHMLRKGLYSSAQELTAAAGIKDLVDSHVFADAREVVSSLRRHELAHSLAWCAENRVKLKRIKSKLEFKLRLQEFIELVRGGRRLEAVQAARKHLAPWASQHMPEMQRAVATLAFMRYACHPPPTSSAVPPAPPTASAPSTSPPHAAAAAAAGAADATNGATPMDGVVCGGDAGATSVEVVAATASTSGTTAGGGASASAAAGGEGGAAAQPHWPAPLAAYAALFEASQWGVLVDLFLKDLNRLNSLTPESLLTVHLQAGLSALKTPLSYQKGCSREDPLHLPAFQVLAQGLPYAKHVHSKLVCSITKEVMTDANPPMVLPNGYVYSRRAVEAIAAQHGGRVVCPRTHHLTHTDYGMEELRRAFVV